MLPRNSPQVEFLLANFEFCLKIFDQACPFGTSKVASHRATIGLVRQASKPLDVLDSEEWSLNLMETLAEWGMNARGARLRDLSAVRDSFIGSRSLIGEIQDYHLADIDYYDVGLIGRKVWHILESLEIGMQNPKLVVNTKALHHLLPDLVPPIDRKYTLSFFFNSGNMQLSRQQYMFEEMWPAFHRIAQKTKLVIQNYLGQGMHTSIPKTIDNAIVGCVLIIDALPQMAD